MQRIITLTPPRISPEHIKEKVTGIRAHRERIFQIGTQIENNKLICHNYGHGGAGWTFLFGSVNESIRQFEQQLELHPDFKNKPITIIGAGCYGLLTAVTLAHKGYSVKIVAADTQNIPSNIAAGFFFPRARKSSTDAERAIFLSTGMETFKTCVSIINGTHPFIKHGPTLLPAYFGLDIDPGLAPYIQQGLIPAPQKVTIDFGNGKIYEVMEYTSLFANPSTIMQELYRNITELHIPIIKTHVNTFEEIEESILFNCAGLGAKQLTQDKRIIPVQGHLITLKDQPDMAQLQYLINVKVTMMDAKGRLRDELIYYAPKESGILGITFIRGQDSLTANQHEFDRLLQRCRDFFGT